MQPYRPRQWSSADMALRTSPPPPSYKPSALKYANGSATDQPDSDEALTKFLGRSSSAKIAAMAERRVARGVELQNQLVHLQEDLKKVKDKLAVTEEEKTKIVDELEAMRSQAEAANLKLGEALDAQKQAEEGWETEKIRFKELEQASVESAQKRDQAWQLELEALQMEHSLDAEALASATQELTQVNQELSLALKDKKEALREAEAARTVAEANSKRVKELLLKLDSGKEPLSRANSTQASEMGVIDLEKVQNWEVNMAEKQQSIEKLELELSNDEECDSQAADPLSASMVRIQKLELELEKARESEAKTFESLISQTKLLEETKISLEEAKLEITSLHENIKSLEAFVVQSNKELSASHRCLEIVKHDTNSVIETVEALKSELQITKDNLAHAQEREKLSLLNARSLNEEMNILRNELKLAMEAEEKSKKAMDGLALALKEVTTEANQAKENLASTESKLEKAGMDVDRLKLRLMRAEEKFQGLLDEAKTEAQQDAKVAKQESNKLRDILKQAVNEATVAKEAAEIARTENSQLKDNLSDMGSMLERVNLENERLKNKEGQAPDNVNEQTTQDTVATPPNEPEPPKKPNTTGKKGMKFLSGPLKKQPVQNVGIERPRAKSISKDEDEDPDTCKGSIFDRVLEQDDEPPATRIMTHRRAASAVLFDDVNFEDFDPMDGILDETESGNLDSRHKKKKALLRRFGGMLRKKSTNK